MEKDYNAFVFEHPLIQHKVTMLRNAETDTKNFRELVEELSMLMAYEVTRNLPLKDVKVETPLGPTTGKMLADRKIALVPILRAGLGMVSGMQKIIPQSRVGHIGLYRDPESLEPIEYYFKMPSDIADSEVIILDPMLATGGSGSACITQLKKRGVKYIKWVCIIASVEGVKRINEDHPDVEVFCAALDEKLNDHAYIIPGLGDAGDRLFGTK